MAINITLRDVADAAGVSPMAVSRAINGRPAGVRLSAETQARILSIVRQSGYRPNRIARDMVLGRQSTIGLVLAAGGPAASTLLIQEVEPILSAAGYRSVVVILLIDSGTARDRVMTLLDDGVAGILCCPAVVPVVSSIMGDRCPLTPLAPAAAQSLLNTLGVPVPVIVSQVVPPPEPVPEAEAPSFFIIQPSSFPSAPQPISPVIPEPEPVPPAMDLEPGMESIKQPVTRDE